jgi:hypothetical protein
MPKIPTPEERPDLCDFYDFPDGDRKLTKAYKEAVLPQSIKDRRAAAAANMKAKDPGRIAED